MNKIAAGFQSKGSFKALMLAGAVCGALSAGSAHAALLLTVSEPGFAPATGTVGPGNTITLAGPYGDFTTNIVIGYSNSTTPSAVAELQVQSLEVVNLTSTGSKSLTVSLTDTSYNFPGAPGQPLVMTSSIGGTFTAPKAGDGFTFQSTAVPGGPALSTSTPLQTYTAASSSPGATAVSTPDRSVLFAQTGSYSLSNQLVLSLSSPGETVNLSGSTTVAVSSVPEPTIGAVAAIASFGLLRRRRRSI